MLRGARPKRMTRREMLTASFALGLIGCAPLPRANDPYSVDELVGASRVFGHPLSRKRASEIKGALDWCFKFIDELRELDGGEVEPLASLSFGHLDDQLAQRLPRQSLARARNTTPVSDPSLLSVAEAGLLIQAGRLSPVDLTRACLDRIDSLNPRVHAVITVIREEALERAREMEAEIRAGHYRGSFHGIPYGVKDVIASAGHLTTCGSRILRNHVTDFDATPVARLQEAGAILVAKLSLGEFCAGDDVNPFTGQGPTRNPWNLECSATGSSSGPAAAVAASMCSASLGTDSLGWIQPPPVTNPPLGS